MILISSDHHHHAYQAFATQGERGISSRLAELLAVEDELFAIATDAGCHTHLRLGDLFHRKGLIDAVVYSEVASKLRRNQEAGVAEIILRGNHDAAAGGLRHSLEALHTGSLARVISRPETLMLNKALKVTAVPYMEDTAAQVEAIRALALDMGGTLPRLLVSHLQIDGAKAGSEYRLPGKVTLADLRASAFNLVFLGHVHEPQQLAAHACYVGSMTQTSFADEGRPRSCILLDEHTMRWERVDLPGPRFVTVRLDAMEDLEAFTPERVYYRVIIRTRRIPTAHVVRALEGACPGFVVQHELPSDRPQMRLPERLVKWEDIVDAYVESSEVVLDKAKLAEIGRALVHAG